MEVTLVSDTGLNVDMLDRQTCSVAVDTRTCTFTGLRHNTTYMALVGTAGVASAAVAGVKTWTYPPASIETPRVKLTPQNVTIASIGHYYSASPERYGLKFRLTASPQLIPNNLPDAYSGFCYSPASGWSSQYWSWTDGAPLGDFIWGSGTSLNANQRYHCIINPYRSDAGFADDDVETPTFTTSLGAWPVPATPSAPRVSAGAGRVSVSWTAPSDNGTDILRYRATTAGGGASCESATLSCDITGLGRGTYQVSVAAISSAGTSESSVLSEAVTILETPGAPGSVSATRAGSGAVRVSWSAAAGNGSAVTGYSVTASGAGGQKCTTTVATTPDPLTCDVSGLVNGTSYTFAVTATNSDGTGPSRVSASIIPAGVPGAPTGVSGRPGNERVSLSWSAPSATGGLPITGYSVTVVPAAGSCVVSAEAATCTGLANGTAYTFSVTAANEVGDSAPSGVSTPVIPRTAPGVPTGVSASRAGSGVLRVTWVAPQSTGGVPIKGYVVSVVAAAGAASGSCTISGTAATCSGLTNGKAYQFRVAARNEATLTSAPSVASTALAPGVAPNVPTAITVTKLSSTSVKVAWKAPAQTGGLPITGYTVTRSGSAKTCTTSGVATLSCTVTGLSRGVAYRFAVTARNDAGRSSASPWSTAITLS